VVVLNHINQVYAEFVGYLCVHFVRVRMYACACTHVSCDPAANDALTTVDAYVKQATGAQLPTARHSHRQQEQTAT
jgi:hypothetical protein